MNGKMQLTVSVCSKVSSRVSTSSALGRREHSNSTFLPGVWMLRGTNATTVLRIKSVTLLQNTEIP